MKLSKLLVYLIVFAALATYVYFVEIKQKEKTQAAQDKAERVVDLKKDDVVYIELESPAQGKIEMKKVANQWVVTEPVKTKADDREVETFLHSIISGKREKLIADKDVNWAEYGLDQPSFKVTLGTKDSKTLVSFGATNPAKTSYYVRVAENPQLLLVADTLKNSLNKTAFDMRDKTVVALAPADVERLTMAKEGKQVELTREDPATWRMTSPEKMKVKKSLIESGLRALTGLRARKILDNPSETADEYGLDKPEFTAVMAGKQREVTLDVGKAAGDGKGEAGPSPDRFARVKGDKTVYVVEGRLIKGLKLDPESLRDRSLFAFDPHEIEKFKIDLDGKTWEASRDKDKNWNLEEPEKKAKIETWLVTKLLWDLKDLEWKSSSKPASDDLAPFNLDKPRLTVAIYKKGETTPIELKAGWEAKKSEPIEGTASSAKSESPSPPTGKPEPEELQQPEKSDVPPTVNAMVQPHEDSGLVFSLSGDFIKKLQDGLGKLVSDNEGKGVVTK